MTALVDGQLLLPWLVGVLLIGAAAASALPRAARGLCVLTLLLATACAMGLLGAVLETGVVRHAVGGWSAPLGIELHADGAGTAAALATVAVMLVCALVTGARSQPPAFWMLWAWTAPALVVLFVTADLFNAYVALELIGLCAAGLVALAGGATALAAAARYLLVGLVASALFLLGVALAYAHTGTLALGPAVAGLEDAATGGLALGLMSLGLLMKAAAFPFHGWLPPAHANAPAAASAVLSALVVKAGVVLLWRLWAAATPAQVPPGLAEGIGVLALGAILWGGVQALRAPRLKAILAYSTVAQVGFLVLVLAMVAAGREDALGPGLALLLVHALAKAAAFCAAGRVMAEAGSDRLESLEGLAARMPLTTLALAVAAIALVGLPPSASFVAKWELLAIAGSEGQWVWLAGMLAGTLLPAMYLLRPLSSAFSGVQAIPDTVPERGALVILGLALVPFALFLAPGSLFALAYPGGGAG